MKKLLYHVVITILCLLIGSSILKAQSDDCCWGPGCPTNNPTASIHGAENSNLRCLNSSATVPPQMGTCVSYAEQTLTQGG